MEVETIRTRSLTVADGTSDEWWKREKTGGKAERAGVWGWWWVQAVV
jgi:hypothetical protein